MRRDFEALLVLILLTAGLYWLVNSQKKPVAQVAVGNLPRVLLQNSGIAGLLPQSEATRVLAMTLTVTATPQRLPSGRPAHDSEVRFSTPSANSGDILLAESPADIGGTIRYSIPSGQSQILKVSNLGKLWLSGTAGDKVMLFGELVPEPMI